MPLHGLCRWPQVRYFSDAHCLDTATWTWSAASLESHGLHAGGGVTGHSIHLAPCDGARDGSRVGLFGGQAKGGDRTGALTVAAVRGK